MKQPYGKFVAPQTSQGQLHEKRNSHNALQQGYDPWQISSPSRSWSAESSSVSSDSSSIYSSQEKDTSPQNSPQYSNRRDRASGWNYSQATTTGYKMGYAPARKKSSSLPKAIPEWKPEHCVALDAEMVGVGQYGQNSSIARVVLIDWWGEVLFDEYIKQTQTVTDYRTFISGITPEVLAEATYTLRDARKKILRILYGKFLIGHALKNDLKALGISHPWWLIRDTARYDTFMQRIGAKQDLWPRKLKDLSAEILGKEIQIYGQPHSPYEDALAALELYKSVQNEWEQIMGEKVEKTNEIQAEERNFQKRMMKQQKQHYHEWLRFQQQQQYDQYPAFQTQEPFLWPSQN